MNKILKLIIFLLASSFRQYEMKMLFEDMCYLLDNI